MDVDTPAAVRRRRCWWCRSDVRRVSSVDRAAGSEDSRVLLRDASARKAGGGSGRGSGQCAAYSGCALWWTSLLLCWVFCAYFFSYIVQNFFAQPWQQWDTIQNFAEGLRPVPICVHWVGGSVVMLLGPAQLIPQVRNAWPAFHRWVGRVYTTAALITSLAGAVYIVLCGTVGGPAMDASFMLYGVMFGTCSAMAWREARAKRFARHRMWAVRAFVLGCGSALYRVEVFPLFVGLLHLPHWAAVLWLNIAAWLFYLPPLAVAELLMWVWWRSSDLDADPKHARGAPGSVNAGARDRCLGTDAGGSADDGALREGGGA